MPITLPTDPAPNGASPLLRDFGGVLTPFLGGPEQRINRLGTRFGVRVTMPVLRAPDQGRVFVARLLRAREDRLLMEWPLNGFDPGNPGAPRVSAATAGGMTLPMKGLTAGYPVKEGQFLSVIHGGRRYVHQFAADGIANGSGALSALIFPMLRTALSNNDVIEIVQPMIEGHVMPGEELGWELALGHFLQLSFSVMEAA